jgi:hypothetical protein
MKTPTSKGGPGCPSVQRDRPNANASRNLPNAHAPLEVVSGRPDSQSARNPARPKQRPFWATVWGQSQGCKWLGRVCSSFKSIYAPWTSSTWQHRETFGSMPLSIKSVSPSIGRLTALFGQSWKSAPNTIVFTHMFSRIGPRPALTGLLKSPTCRDGSSTWQSRLSHTMHSRSRANTCKLLEPQKRQASGCRDGHGRTAYRERLYVIKSVSFAGAS